MAVYRSHATHHRPRDVLKQIFPDRVRLNTLNSIFYSWVAHDAGDASHQLSKRMPAPYNLPYHEQKFTILYDHDRFKYRSTVVFADLQGYPRIEIKLSNDGFIFPQSGSLTLDPTYSQQWHFAPKAQGLGQAFPRYS